jgi:hypothetical protein
MIGQNDDGQAHIRTMFSQFYESQKAAEHDSVFDKEKNCFCYDPGQYSWAYVGQKSMLVPCGRDSMDAAFPATSEPVSLRSLKWELRAVWIVDGLLHRGESNLLARRRFYIDETSWMILFGDGFDSRGNLLKCYVRHLHPATYANPQGRWYLVGDGGLSGLPT